MFEWKVSVVYLKTTILLTKQMDFLGNVHTDLNFPPTNNTLAVTLFEMKMVYAEDAFS